MRSLLVFALLFVAVTANAQVVKGLLHKPFQDSPKMDAAGSFDPRGFQAKSGWIEYADSTSSRTWIGYTPAPQGVGLWVMVKTAIKTMSGGVAEIDFTAGQSDCGKRAQGRFADYLISPSEQIYDAQGLLLQDSGVMQNTPIPADSIMADAVKYACSKQLH